MVTTNNNNKFVLFRERFREFFYESFQYTINKGLLSVSFHFHIDHQIHFHPGLEFPILESSPTSGTASEKLGNMIFALGMAELISYWKAACPAKVIIKPAFLNDDQVHWWKKLYYYGLGEFFYINGIKTSFGEFMTIRSQSEKKLTPFRTVVKQQTIVPVGGGKDSAVSLELLQSGGIKTIPFIINPNQAQEETIRAAGIINNSVLRIKRTLDKGLLELNRQGFLNGHTPFSAIVAFTSLIAAFLSESEYIALSNEASANEATIPGTDINHQYSKSIGFENDFRTYVAENITPDIKYFSFLRPLSELQIAAIFSRYEKYHRVFRSCNAGSKEGKWCGKCPKCLFTFIILSPYLPMENLIDIFNKDLFNDAELIPIFDELTGISPTKPFECVGTLDEVNIAFMEYMNRNSLQKSILSEHYKKNNLLLPDQRFRSLSKHYNFDHNLPDEFEKIIQNRIHESNFR